MLPSRTPAGRLDAINEYDPPVALAPRIRVNAVAPATVVEGSAMFPRDRVMASLAIFLLTSRRLGKTTGQALNVDGGLEAALLR